MRLCEAAGAKRPGDEGAVCVFPVGLPAIEVFIEPAERAAEVAHALSGRGPVHSTPVHRKLSQQRRFVTVHTELADYRAIEGVAPDSTTETYATAAM